MDDNIDIYISKTLSGDASSEDIIALCNWLNSDKKNKIEFSQLKSYWDAEVSFSHSIDPHLSIEKLKERIRTEEKRKRIGIIYLSIAATIALLFALSQLLFTTEEQETQFYTYLTDDNKSEVLLKDGTKVTLNKHSRLSYSNTYGRGLRQVKLEGEGYFEVSKDSLNPFKVEMEGACVQVLGTKFNVKANPGNDIITTTLLEGSIRFESLQQRVILNPGQQLLFVRSSNQIAIQSVDSKKEVIWKDKLLKYKSIVFSSLMKELENIYQIPIVITNQRLLMPTILVSCTFSDEQTLEEILDIINRSLPIQWNKENKTYYIH